MRKLKMKDINFYARYSEKPKTSTKFELNPKVLGIVCGILLLAALSSLATLRRSQLREVKKTYATLSAQVQDPQLLEDLEHADWLAARMQVYEQLMENQKADMQAITDQDAKVEAFTDSLIADVFTCQTPEAKVDSVWYQDGSLYVDGIAVSAADATVYVSKLRSLPQVKAVAYPGYMIQGETYAFTVKISLNDLPEKTQEGE